MIIKFSKIKDDQSEDKPRAEARAIAALVIAAGLRAICFVVLLGSAFFLGGILIQIVKYYEEESNSSKFYPTSDYFVNQGSSLNEFTL